MVYRIFVEKKRELANEAAALKAEMKTLYGMENLSDIRVVNRYDVENIDADLFDYCKSTVFSEPQLDLVFDEIDVAGAGYVLAVEFLPGQFDQRADSAAQCIQIISQKERPTVKSAKIYMLYGNLSDADKEQFKKYVINPVECREASSAKPDTLVLQTTIPEGVETLTGFTKMSEDELVSILGKMGLAMDFEDIKFCQRYFISENRDPTITEIKMIDTYWSDHCRHTTFLTSIDSVKFEDELLSAAYEQYISTRQAIGRTKPVNLMDIATIAARYLRSAGKLEKLDESDEINACTVKIDVDVNGETEKWLLLFKNETHNHPTEIEPFGGAATCIGGAIRDPLSGRAYVYSAMRLTGAADPTVPISETIPGKLPQRKIVTTAAHGYSSYGNQIGLATGQVDEIYHSGYAAKRMELGAVIAAAPAKNVRREKPVESDVIILLGGKTGRDGCGGATGSSKSHTIDSLESCGAEVQKGNAPEERKIQRLFRNPKASTMIKKCNDFGAGGVSVAIGELADGLEVDLNAVPKKYDGLDGTELAISESQERMAVVVDKADVQSFIALAHKENLEATVVAVVKDEPRLKMKWNGKYIVDISREFLNSNGAEKHIDITPLKTPKTILNEIKGDFKSNYLRIANDLNICSKRGLSERFDSTIGAGTVLVPFGGKNQLTPPQAMVNKISLEKEDTKTVSLMAWGYNPFIFEQSQYHGAYLAVVESVSKLIATGAKFEDVYLSFQEYFERLGNDGRRWGKPLAALLGAFKAQKDFEIASIGGKDSMSGSFETLDVPPTLVSFAVTTDNIDNIISPEFKGAGHKVVLIKPDYDENGLPVAASQKEVYRIVNELVRDKKALSIYTPTVGGIGEAIMKMSFGNGIGFEYSDQLTVGDIFGYSYGQFIVELNSEVNIGTLLGRTIEEKKISYKGEQVDMAELLEVYENRLEGIFACNVETEQKNIPTLSYNATSYPSPKIKVATPKFLIPVFPGTNCEYDTAKAITKAGGQAEIFVIRNLSASDITESVQAFAKKMKTAQAVVIPGGFSGGDEPDGSGKFITAFFRNAAIKESVCDLLNVRDGLMCGICNGFQALIKLGLVPYGEIVDATENSPTLTFNTIGRHQSRIVRTRIASNKSPWLMNTKVGEVYTAPISNGEGRFIAPEQVIKELASNGQIATQYVDLDGNPTGDVRFNPSNSMYAVEGITSPDGRVFGKMAHSERVGAGLYKNHDGQYDIGIFKSAIQYYK